MSSPIAGWYPDPYDEKGLRYWDGTAWTESARPAEATTGTGGEPPYRPRQAPSPPPAIGEGYGDVGDWLSDTFRHAWGRVVPLAILLVGLPLLGALIAGPPIVRLLGGFEIDPTGQHVTYNGLEAGPIGLALLGLAAAVLISVIGWFAATHQLYAAHVGQTPSVGRSLGTAVRCLPRAFGWGLVAMAVGLVLMAVTAMVIGMLSILTQASAAAGVLVVVVAFIAAACGWTWLLVRLSLAAVPLVVGRRGGNPFGQSWEITRDRWWATFGRLVLAMVILFAIGFTLNIFTQIVTGATGFQLTTVGDQVYLNGEPIPDDEIFRPIDHLPSLGGFAILLALSTASQAVQQAIQIAAAVGLYIRGGGTGEV